MNDNTFSWLMILFYAGLYFITGFDADETVRLILLFSFAVVAVFVALAIYMAVTTWRAEVDPSPVLEHAREEESCWHDHVHIARWYGGRIPAPTSRGFASDMQPPPTPQTKPIPPSLNLVDEDDDEMPPS